MNETFECCVSMEWINPDWIDVNIMVEAEIYNGSNYDDDPSTCDVFKITIDDNFHEYGLIKGTDVPVTSRLKDMIAEIYFEQNPTSSPTPNQVTAYNHGY